MTSISPVSVWTPAGVVSATKFRVNSVVYAGGTARASCQLFSAGGTALADQSVNATAEQCAEWTDDDAFYRVLAQNAGLSPL